MGILHKLEVYKYPFKSIKAYTLSKIIWLFLISFLAFYYHLSLHNRAFYFSIFKMIHDTVVSSV